MATRAFTYVPTNSPKATVATWTGLLNADDGTPCQCAQYKDRTVQVSGVIGVGFSAQIEGSNDGTNWDIVTDLAGATVVFTALGSKIVRSMHSRLRPKVTAGDGTTNVTVTIALVE